jgi:hypothetical protein
MRKAPKKILYQEALRTGEENGDARILNAKERDIEGAGAAGEEFS